MYPEAETSYMIRKTKTCAEEILSQSCLVYKYASLLQPAGCTNVWGLRVSSIGDPKIERGATTIFIIIW